MAAKAKPKASPPVAAATSSTAAPAAAAKRSALPTACPVAKVAAIAWDGQLPPDSAPQDALLTMRHVMQAVLDELPAALRSAVGNASSSPTTLFDEQPLQIKDKLADGELSTFRAPWQRAQCLMAVKSTGLYEAACNLFWLDVRAAHRLNLTSPSSDLLEAPCMRCSNVRSLRALPVLVA